MHFAALFSDLQMMAPAAWAWFTSAWQAFAETAGNTLVTSIWQGAVVVCGIEIAMRLMPRISAAHRFAVWAAGFGLAAAIPLFPLLHFGSSSDGVSSAPQFAGGSAHALLQLDARWGMAIAGIWVVASLIRGADLAVHSVRLRRLWKAAQPVDASPSLAAALKTWRGGRVAICTTEMLDRPSVIGFFAPRILIPNWLLSRVTPGELEQIVLHEAEHLRRHDDWTNLVQKLCLVAFPINPALAWMEHHLCREREMACDEGVVRITNAPRAYAACLASLAERGLERRAEALSLGAWHRRSELVHRVHRILLRKHGMSRTAAGALLGAVGCMLIAGSVEMARCPQLIAFVPRQNNLAMTPARQQQLATMLSRENAETRASLPIGFHAVQAKDVLPNRVSTMRHQSRRRDAAAMPSKAIATGGAQQIAKADEIGDRVNSGGAEQQWVVLAAWEEVQTVSRTQSAVADYDAGATTGGGSVQSAQQNAGKAGAQASSRTPNQATSGYTVTRLILRVVPANSKSNSTQPATESVRGGWFVIQL